MALSRNEELIFRELKAMAGDIQQIAANLIRDYEERVKEAEEWAARRREEAPDKPQPGYPMRSFDRPGLTKDLTFIRARLNLLLEYASPEPLDPRIPGINRQ